MLIITKFIKFKPLMKFTKVWTSQLCAENIAVYFQSGSLTQSRSQQTVATYFRLSLQHLLNKLSVSHPHFVRYKRVFYLEFCSSWSSLITQWSYSLNLSHFCQVYCWHLKISILIINILLVFNLNLTTCARLSLLVSFLAHVKVTSRIVS